MQMLSTKLSIPPLRSSLVPRLRLIQKLNQGWESGFVLVSAPAGYGKSTLLNAWLSDLGCPAAWLSLDEGDNESVRFLTYLAAALYKIDPAAAETLETALQSPAPPVVEMLLPPLVNYLAQVEHPFWLVLDDYHVIQNEAVHQVVRFLLQHRPRPFHMAIATRADPPLPLARLRARSQMTEVRMADLRFSTAEISVFLNQGMGLNLVDADLALLETTTEGWIAGLQMAGLSLLGREDASSFIRFFSGENRFILDFLFEEVLQQQPLELQTFLLQTSILERLSAPLCNAVTMRQDSQTILDTLERTNLFLILLDEQRKWYRYHHLFTDLLKNRLLRTSPDLCELLHQRASAWYATEHDLENAIIHALAGKDYERAASLLEQIVQTLDKHNKQAVLTLWLEKLPSKTLERHPWLCVYRAWGYYWTGQRGMEEEWLQAAEKIIERTFEKESQETRHIRGHIGAIRSFVALSEENIPCALEMGHQALELLPESDYGMRCETAVALGGVYWALGDVTEPERAFAMARSAGLKVSRTMAVPSTCYVGIQQVKQGRLLDAVTTFRDGLHLATLSTGYETPIAGFPNVKLGDIWREQNDLALALQHLSRGVEQCIRLGQPDVLADAYVCMGRYQLAVGNWPGAYEALDKAEQIGQQAKVDPFVLSGLDECRLKSWLAEGNLEGVTLWLQKSDLLPDEPFNYLHDLHHQNLARALVVQGILSHSSSASEQAVPLLARLKIAAAKVGWVHEEIKVLVLQAVNEQVLGKPLSALQSLVAALSLSEPGGYVRVFIDEGQIIRALLVAWEKTGWNKQQETVERLGINFGEERIVSIQRYVARLVSAFENSTAQAGPTMPETSTTAEQTKGEQCGRSTQATLIIEPLSPREMEVLHLLVQGHADKKIAENLVIARETVHKHLKNIYEKLGVHSRTEAAARGRELGLL